MSDPSLSRMAFSLRTQMMCWQCCRWIVSKWVFHLLAFSFLILHCVALVLVVDNATDQPDMWRSSSLRNGSCCCHCLPAFLLARHVSFAPVASVFLRFLNIQPQDQDLFWCVSNGSTNAVLFCFRVCTIPFWILMRSYI